MTEKDITTEDATAQEGGQEANARETPAGETAPQQEGEGKTKEDDGTTTAPESESETKEEEEKDPLEAANEQIAALTDKYLRSVAELDNYRKRTMREKAELIINGSEKAVTALLPIIDDMERALAGKTDDAKLLKEGMEMIHNKFVKALETLGVKAVDTTDADFNTDLHEAIAMVPAGDDKKGKVVDCVQKGYTLNNKVIRHAKVAVGQ